MTLFNKKKYKDIRNEEKRNKEIKKQIILDTKFSLFTFAF